MRALAGLKSPPMLTICDIIVEAKWSYTFALKFNGRTGWICLNLFISSHYLSHCLNSFYFFSILLDPSQSISSFLSQVILTHLNFSHFISFCCILSHPSPKNFNVFLTLTYNLNQLLPFEMFEIKWIYLIFLQFISFSSIFLSLSLWSFSIHLSFSQFVSVFLNLSQSVSNDLNLSLGLKKSNTTQTFSIKSKGPIGSNAQWICSQKFKEPFGIMNLHCIADGYIFHFPLSWSHRGANL